MAGVSFQNVSKSFDADSPALKQFNLNIEDGEFMVLVGPSGCGKSTALRLLSGLEQVSEGDILIDERVVNDITPQQRNIAMVFQNYALYPHMTVRDNLAFPLKMSRVPARQRKQKITQVAELLDLGELLSRRPAQLSGGQRQRVAMGRALVRDPSVFLLDEPLSNLDAQLRAQIRADIAQLQKQLNKTTLYVTHDQVEAMTLGDRVAVIKQGELQQVGTPEELYARPRNCFVASFIGSPGMNIIPARLVNRTDHVLRVRFGQQVILLPTSDYGFDCSPGTRLFVGLRPEALHTSPPGNAVELPVRVNTIEYLGHESLVHFQLLQDVVENTEEDVLVARLPGHYSATNDSVQKLFINLEAIYLFDEQGNAILGTGEVTVA